MRYKPDWEDAKRRLTALWNHKLVDRPCISVTAPSGAAVEPPPEPETPRQRWLDPDWVLADLAHRLASTWWGGESIPSYLLMGGWVLCLGGRPRFDQRTIWFETQPVDFSRPSPFGYDEGNEWVQAHTALYEAVVDFAGRDDFLVGKPTTLPANDLLSMLMGTDAFLINLIDHRDWMRAAILTGAREQLRMRQLLRDRIQDKHEFWYGNAGWMPFWAPEPYVSTQSDVSCMLSQEMFERFVVPELDVCGGEFGAMWYHLDGRDARHHLPRLLSLPYMRVVQYVPTPAEPPNGPEHLDLYREIQAAGRIVHIDVALEYVEHLYRALDPALLLVQTRCASADEGQALLDAAAGWI